MDVIASLERRPGEGNNAAFVRWVAENMLRVRPLPCSALELYAARCGIVHTFTADSDLSRDGRARKVIYAWGSARAEDLAEVSKLLGRTEVAIHIRDLIDSFRAGLVSYLEDVARSPARLQRVEAGTGLWFENMDQNLVKEFLDTHQELATEGTARSKES